MPKTKENETDATLEEILGDFKSAWSYAHDNYHDTWADCWALYNNKRTDRAYEGITDTFVPITFSTVETMVAALAGSRPRFDFTPTEPGQNQETKVLNGLLDFYWEADKWQSKVDRWIRSMLLYGTGVMYIWWDIDRPRLINVPIRDYFVDPSATNPDNARFMGRRYLTTKSELESFEYVDPETGEMKKMYENLDKVEMGDTGEKTDKEEKDIFLGSTLGEDASSKQVEVIEYWTEDRKVCIANRTTIISDVVNPYKAAAKARGEKNPEGIIPFIVQRDYADESLFFGKGEVEPIKGQQELLNDLTNQNNDAIIYTLNPMFTLDPAYSDYADDVESVPGRVFPFESGALQPIEMANVPQDAFNERLNIKNEIRETTASDQVVKGISQDTSATATEIVSQINQAGQRFAIKISQIEDEGYYDLAKTVLAMVQLYVTEPMAVRVMGEGRGIDWQTFDPSQLEGEYEPNVMLESTVTANKETEKTVAQDMFVAMFGNPLVNQQELTRMTLQKVFDLDEDRLNALMSVEEQGFGEEELGLEGEFGGEVMEPELTDEEIEAQLMGAIDGGY